MSTPSTDWREVVQPGEAERHARQSAVVTGIQARRNEKEGAGRAFHRRPVLALRGVLEIAATLPDHARHGLFAQPGPHPCLIRLSNGATRSQADRVPDVRGFALGVDVAEGPGALGGPTTRQDFLLINRAAFGFPTSAEFIAVVEALARGPLALVWHFLSTYGLFAGFSRLRALQASVEVPFSGFATTPFFSAAPVAVGPYAARVRLLDAPRAPAPEASDFTADMRARLAAGPLTWTLQLQFFVDEARTPIEDAERPWPEDVAPWEDVGTLTVHATPEAEAEALAAAVEADAFDPWRALEAHRPLGEVMRARKPAYLASQQGRRPAG